METQSEVIEVSNGASAQAVGVVAAKKSPLAFIPSNLDDAWRIAEMMARSNLLPDTLKAKPYDVLIVLMTGVELGLSPMQAVRDIVVVKGRPYTQALLKVALVKQSRNCKKWRLIESTNERAVYETEHARDGVQRMEYTFEDAKRAGVIGRQTKSGEPDNWEKWLRLMLRRRCQSQLIDEVYPDVVRGIGDKEDLDDAAEMAKDVTPPESERVETRTESVKAAVMASGKARRLAIQDEAPEPRASPPTDAEVVKTPGDVVAELVAAAGVPASRSRAFVLGATGKKNRADLTDADVETVREALSVFDTQVVNEGGAP